MHRKEPLIPGGKGRSLIATRTNQQEQRIMQGPRSHLPRSYSSPASQKERSPETAPKSYVLRSFSSPEPNRTANRRNSESFYKPKSHGSRSELDSDLENFDQFEESLLDIDADNYDFYNQHQKSFQTEEPKRILTTMLPGSGLQRVAIRPITSNRIQANMAAMNQPKKENKRLNRLNFRPLIVKMPSQIIAEPECESILGLEELQASPEFDLEAAELDRELDNAEEHLKREISIASAESDHETEQTPYSRTQRLQWLLKPSLSKDLCTELFTKRRLK